MNDKIILFDLDGTLLPMEQDYFLTSYLKLIGNEMAAHGYDPHELVSVIMQGTEKMLQNDGNKTNEEVFWEYFVSVYGERARLDQAKFHAFYIEKFPLLQKTCGYNELTPQLISALKKQGYKLILATNPIFPRVATLERMRWAGLEESDFLLVTTYENSHYAKPNPLYYAEILTKLNAHPSEVMMIGNDTTDDYGAVKQGIKTFFVTDDLINKNGLDLKKFPHGSLRDLTAFLALKL
ncbi:MAG TPA: HAD family hydrolase [Bacilli bacterium]|nr:HAD family hydrolase [Bacilli bacterium]